MRFSLPKSVIITLLSMLSLGIWVPSTKAQGGNLGSNSSPVVNRQGIPLPGVNIAVCQAVTVSAASISNNLFTLTFPNNASTYGFVVGMTIATQGFTGADAPIFNAGSIVNGVISGGNTILSVTGKNITFATSSGPATATSFGSVLGQGNSTTPCAGISSVFSDTGLTISTANPFVSDQLGNWNVFALPGTYYVQFYSPTVGSTIKIIVNNSGSLDIRPLNNNFTGSNNFFGALLINSLPAIAVSGAIIPGDCASWATTTTLQDSGGACGGGGGGGSFGSLSTGTNTQATMTVGTGASILATGSGTIAATSAPFAGILSGTNVVGTMVIGSTASLSFSGSGSINASKINGTSIPVNSAADQTLLTSASAVGLWSSIPICLDSAGQHLNYNTATHAFSCGTSGGTAGSAAFNTITSGTNTQAAMVVGTGASLAVTGSGTIAATSSPFAGILSGTNTGASMVLGTGSSLTVSGSGTNNANQLSGTTAPASSGADQLFGTTATNVGQWATVPGCLDAGGNHLNYNNSTHAFSCGTTGGTAGSAAFNTITSGTNASAAMVVGTGSSLTTSGSGTITATGMLFSGLTTATNTTATLTVGTGAVMTTSGSGQINANLITSTTVPASSAADQFLGTTATSVGQWAPMPNCLDVSGQHINYNISTHAFACGTTSSGGGGGGSGTVIASPQYSLATFPNSGSSATVSGAGIHTDSTFNNLFVPGTSCFSGPSPWVDITCPPYNARPVTINTTATGSGTTITVGVSTFQNNDNITIAAVGNAPTMVSPTGLTVTPSVSAGYSAQDSPTVPGLSGASPYTYTIFPVDILGGANAPLTPVTITTGNATLGPSAPFAISTLSLSGNTVTITTTAPTGLPNNVFIDVRLTSDEHHFAGWYPVNSVSGSTITITNVSQFCSPACTATGGQLVAYVGNRLAWTASSPTQSFNSTWEYGICAKRPADSALHLIAMTYPQSLNTPGNANIVQVFNDFGPNFNTPVPWDLSDANCTAGSAQPQRYTGTVTAGGGTPTLTVTPALPVAATGQLARYDAGPAITAASNAAGTTGTAYIPQTGNGNFPINSVVGLGFKRAVAQQGDLQVNAPIYSSTVGWYGLSSASGGAQFAQRLGPVARCQVSPCLYTGAAQQGNSTVSNVSFWGLHNTVNFMLDSPWGVTSLGNTFSFGQIDPGNLDFSGNCVLIRPQGAEYKFQDFTCDTGPGGSPSSLDFSWAPGFYGDGLCGGTNTCPNSGSIGTIYINTWTQTARGFLVADNGGAGTNVKIDVGYSQGAIMPNFNMQNIQGNVGSTFSVDQLNHDTESQAVFAGICGLGCASAFNGAANIAPRIGHVNQVAQSAGTYPWQVTGGGNARMLIDLAVLAQGGNEQGLVGVAALSRGVYFSQNRVYNYGGVLTNDPNLGISDFSPNVPTPAVALEQGSFFNTESSAILTGNQTRTAPNASGVECLTGLVDCSYTPDTGAANAYVISVVTTPPLTALVDGMKFRIKASHANTTTSTLVVNAIASHNIQKFQSGSLVNLSANDISLNCEIEVTWDAGDAVYQLTSPCNGSGGGGGSGIVGNCTTTNALTYQPTNGTTTACIPEGSAARFEQGVDNGAVNAYIITSPVPITSLVDGVEVYFRPLNSNTSTATANVDSSGVFAIQKLSGTGLVAGDLLSGGTYHMRYNASLTAWIVLNPSLFGSVIPIAGGGTGQTSASAAFNALAPGTSGCSVIVANGVNSYTSLPCINSTTLTVSAGGVLAFTAPSTISGSGTSGQCTFWNGVSTVTGSPNCLFNAGSGMTLAQGANGTTMLGGSRFTDTSPTGFFEQYQNHALNQNVYSVDVSGNIVSQGSLTVGSNQTQHFAQFAGGTPTGCLTNFTAISADATGNAMICNNNVGFQYIISTGGDINNTNQVTSTHLAGLLIGNVPKVNAAGTFLNSNFSDNAINTFDTEDLDMQTNSIVAECTNDTTTGTTNNLLAEITTTGCIKATATLTTPAYIIERGGATSGVSQYVTSGVGHCIMDATNASGAFGFFVIKSSTVGDCHAQAAAPSVGQWLVGQLLATSTTLGVAAPVNALNEFFTSSGAGTGTVTSVATTSPITGGTFTTSGTIACATCVVATVNPGAGVGHFAGSTQTITSSAVVGADMTNHTVTATQLAAQYSTWVCETGIGDGLNAIPAGTYPQFFCVNTTGVTVTLTGLNCWTDNAGTSTMNATNNAGTGLLTGAVTCNSTKSGGGAAGTQSATTTLANNDAITFSFVADGTSKQTTWTIKGTY